MKKIVILSGGTGTEIEVAKKSATFFKNYLKKDYDYYVLPEQIEEFLEHKSEYSLAVPIFHGEYGEDGKIFAFLNVLNIPHTFSDYFVHSLCIDKYKTNILAEKLNIKIPKQIIFNLKNNGVGEILNMMEKTMIDFPIIFKPNTGGSSFYTYKIEDREDLSDKINICKEKVDGDIIIQEFITGEEYSVSIVDREVLPIMKIEKQNKGDFFDYDSKYESETKMKETWPEIESSLKEKLEENTKKIYDFFHIKGFSRVDYLVRDDEVFFLEINTIPGMTEASILPKSWKLSGKSFEDLIKKLIEV